MKTILTLKEQALVKRAIADISDNKFKSKSTCAYTKDEMNLLQAIFFAVRQGMETKETVDNDLNEDIINLGIGLNNYWGITHLSNDYVTKILKEGLKIFI